MKEKENIEFKDNKWRITFKSLDSEKQDILFLSS